MTIFHVLLCFLNSTICLRVCSIKGFPDYYFFFCNKVLLKYKGDRESFWHRHQKGAETVPPQIIFFKIKNIGNSLTVDSPLVRTRHFHCGGLGSSPCWRTKIQQATWCGQNTNCKKTHTIIIFIAVHTVVHAVHTYMQLIQYFISFRYTTFICIMNWSW